MKAEELIRAMSEIDERLVEQAWEAKPAKKPLGRLRVAAFAAAAVLVCVIGLRVILPGLMQNSSMAENTTLPETDGQQEFEAAQDYGNGDQAAGSADNTEFKEFAPQKPFVKGQAYGGEYYYYSPEGICSYVPGEGEKLIVPAAEADGDFMAASGKIYYIHDNALYASGLSGKDRGMLFASESGELLCIDSETKSMEESGSIVLRLSDEQRETKLVILGENGTELHSSSIAEREMTLGKRSLLLSFSEGAEVSDITENGVSLIPEGCVLSGNYTFLEDCIAVEIEKKDAADESYAERQIMLIDAGGEPLLPEGFVPYAGFDGCIARDGASIYMFTVNPYTGVQGVVGYNVETLKYITLAEENALDFSIAGENLYISTAEKHLRFLLTRDGKEITKAEFAEEIR